MESLLFANQETITLLLSQQKVFGCPAEEDVRTNREQDRLHSLQSLCYCCSLQGVMINEKHLHYPGLFSLAACKQQLLYQLYNEKNPLILDA